MEPMLSLYLGCLVFGAILLGASALGGGDHGHDVDHHGPELPKASLQGAFPFLSLRFWSFALAGFGLSGALLSLVGTGRSLTAILSGLVGLVAGWGSWRAIGALTRSPAGLLAGAEAHVGREGTLLFATSRAQRGKLRLSIGGAACDFLTETDADEPLPAGTRVIVVGARGHSLLVERSPAVAAAGDATSSPDTKEDPS
jgi:membrane protein implicated in regulation of membrane protease activity